MIPLAWNIYHTRGAGGHGVASARDSTPHMMDRAGGGNDNDILRALIYPPISLGDDQYYYYYYCRQWGRRVPVP